MDDPSKKMKNPLFDKSVLGGSLQNLFQNVRLVPPKEKSPVPTPNVIPEQISDSKLSEVVSNPSIESVFSEFTYSNPHHSGYSDNFSEKTVLSSFPNLLKLRGPNKNTSKEEIPVSAPALQSTSESVPLFSANTSELLQPKPSSSTGSVNSFRRSNIKRPTYAPPPGLSNNPENIPPQPKPFHPIPQYYPVPSAPSPTDSTSSIEPTIPDLTNYFKPISPPPTDFGASSNISEPVIPVPVQPYSKYLSLLLSPEDVQYNSVVNAFAEAEMTKKNRISPACSFESVKNVTIEDPIDQYYSPVCPHWFVRIDDVWQPFSMFDSFSLEEAYNTNDLPPEKLIPTDGGRYDVNILMRRRFSVYWDAAPNEVRRCSWYLKSVHDTGLIPYEENISALLEEQYRIAFETNDWPKEIDLGRETIIFQGPDDMFISMPYQTPEMMVKPSTKFQPRVVKRGVDNLRIEEGEKPQVDHLLFFVHGIGTVCDIKFRSVEAGVDDFREKALKLVRSHYAYSCEQGKVSRIEAIPISWHEDLHSDETGIDEQLKSITLKSLSRFRNFTNDTLLDVLFYTSPVYSQKIITTVASELNRLYELFKKRNPDFTGGVSLGGHSLGSLILFDLLRHQVPFGESKNVDSHKKEPSRPETCSPEPSEPGPSQRETSKKIRYMMGATGTGQPQIDYPPLNFEPKHLFALGSPIGVFVIVRGLDPLGENFSLPTCPGFFNIFHPYDPVAYRIEPLIDPKYANLKPVLIPHHKGRKRMHLELKETVTRVASDLKEKVIGSLRSTWNTFSHIAAFHRQSPPALETGTPETLVQGTPPSLEDATRPALADETRSTLEDQQFQGKLESENEAIPEPTTSRLGNLNGGRRIDHILQEAPFQYINDYLFALSSHGCYWSSEDTILLILKEIYSTIGITTDNQIPLQTLMIERLTPSQTGSEMTTTILSLQNIPIETDPTACMDVDDLLPASTNTGFVGGT